MGLLIKGVQRVTRWFAVVSASLTMIIMTLIIVDVFARVFTGRSVPGLLELGEVALVFLVYAGVAQAQQTNTHVAVDLLTSRLPKRVATVTIIAGLLVAEAVIAWAVYATWIQALSSVDIREARYGITSVPIWPARLMIPIGLFLLLFEIAIDISEVIRGRSTDEGIDNQITVSPIDHDSHLEATE